MIDPNEPKQPCWRCRKFAGGCSWSKSFEPVAGWKALPTIKSSGKTITAMHSYHIIHCPEFAPDIPGRATSEDYCACCGNYIGENGKQYCKNCEDKYLSKAKETGRIG